MLPLLLLPVLAAEPVDLTAPRRAAIRVLETRVRAEPTPADLLALAELWQQDAEARELVALADHVARYDTCHDTPGCDLAAVSLDLSDANRSRQRATVRYRQLLRDFPESQEVDDAAYGLGWAWRAMGEAALGDAAFTWLLAARPDSTYVNDAWLLVGEQAFEAWNADWARHAYTQVAASDDPRRPWALHRLGWSYYRLGDYPRAIEAMKEVVAEPDGPFGLRDEALKDLVRFFADAGEMDEWYCCEGHATLGKRESMRQLLERLADTYEEQGKFEQAIQVRRRLIAERPEDAAVLAHQARIVQLYRSLGDAHALVAELDRLARLVDAHPDDPRGDTLLEPLLRNVGFDLHRQGRGGGRGDRITLAVTLYTLYAARFPTSPFAPDISWAHAVAAEDLGDLAGAVARYRALATSDSKGRYARDALRAVERLRR